MLSRSAFENGQNEVGKWRNPVYLLWYFMTSDPVLLCLSCHSVALLLYTVMLRQKVRGVSEKLSGQCSRPTIRTCCEGGNRLLEPGLLSPRRCLSGSNLAFTSRLKTCRKVSEDYSSVFLIHHRHRARFTDFYFLIKKPGREHGLPSHDSTLGMCERACFWDLMDDVGRNIFSPPSWSNIRWYFSPHVLSWFFW